MLRFFKKFWTDTDGVILPYVALMLVVFIGFGALALDGGRYMSESTQMQAAADALALAGARELDGQAGSRDRATNAINAMVSNGLTGLGYGAALTHAAPQFYSALDPVGSGGFSGTAATSDYDARFVAVTVNPVTIPTVMPVLFVKPGEANSFSAGGFAVAGFKNRAVCGVSPVFICNPYETSGMTDAEATAALYHALDPNDPSYNAATRRKMFRMTADNTSPGHFGWLQFSNNFDGCNPNSTPCLNKLVAYDDSSLARMCVDGSGVQLATGNKPVPDSFNDRFDIYGANGPSTQFTPSINVRKGYWLKSGTNWCNSEAGDSLSQQPDPATGAAVPIAPVPTTVTAAASQNATTIQVATFTGIRQGMSVVVGTNSSQVPISTVSTTPTGTTISVAKLAQALAINAPVTFKWTTTALPLDKGWNGLCSGGTCLQGNADWDCLNYWNINHSNAAGTLILAAPSGCTASSPTVSRYDVYNYENSQASDNPANSPITNYAGIPSNTQKLSFNNYAYKNYQVENGAPMCAAKSNFTPTFNASYDPRIVNVAVINCLAQTALGNISGGNSGPPTPVAGFAQLFLTQPYNSDKTQHLYGELTGLINGLNANRIFNQVQLYR
jgi:Flp pilus assembly protein TadG